MQVRGVLYRESSVALESQMTQWREWCHPGRCVGLGPPRRRGGSDDEAVPKISSSSRSLYPVRGVVCQPEKMKQLIMGFGPS